MPCAVDYILEGLAKNLELERELGHFAAEFDRDFLLTLPKERVVKSEPAAAKTKQPVEQPSPMSRRTIRQPIASGSAPASSANPIFNFVFLHHVAITGSSASEMMTKVVAAIKQTPETAPIVFEGEKPPAKIYVVLGAKALSQWYEGLSLTNGAWFKDMDSDVFYTWSPMEIYRFGDDLTSAMKQMKLSMWKGLQEGMRKLGISG